ncbi:unnamed protein product, partial [marine sediment metagenome]
MIREAIVKKKGDSRLYCFLASLYQEKKLFKAAEETLKEGLQFSPRSVDIHYKLGILYEETDRFKESIKEMEEILKIEPESAEALNFIGYSYADRGIKLEQAEKMIKKALKLKPGDGYITDSLGWVYLKQNKLDLAIEYLKKASDLLPDDPTIAEHLGDAYAKAGRVKDALKTYKQVLKLN